MPIDPVLAVVGDRATKEVYENARIAMGLDRPLVMQFASYVGDVLTGNLGMSVSTGRPVAEDLARVFPATLEMATLGILIGVLLGVPMGLIAANRQGTWIDQTIRVVGLLGYSVPAFWLGLIGLLLFYARLGWVAGPGRIDVFYDGLVPPITGLLLVDSLIAGHWAIFVNAVSHLILPAAILGFFSLAYIARMTRSFMLDQLGQEFITTARVKGVSERRVLRVHAFRPIRVPLITVIGLSYAGLLEGSVMIEAVFSWPGIGNYLTTALLNADMNAVLGATLVIGAVFIFINKISDVLYRHHLLAGLCPHRPGRDPDLPPSRVHRRRAHAGRLQHADHPAPRAVALHLIDDRARGRYHPDRRGPRLPRPWCAAAPAGVGGDDLARADHHPRPMVGRHHARLCHRPGQPRLLLPRRRPARRTRPETGGPGMTAALLEVANLRVAFPSPHGPVEVVKGVSFTLGRERLGIVGESGSGKSLTGRAILRLIRPPGRVSVDRMVFDGIDLAGLSERAMRNLRGARISMVMQDPKFSLNPSVHRRRPDRRGAAHP